MIRLLVLVLLAANLLYWGWSHWLRDEAPRLVAPDATTATTSTASAAATAPAAPCTSVGPVGEEVRAKEIEQMLRDMQLAPLRRAITVEVPDGWWVYVTSTDAAAQARAVRNIQTAGIRDAFAMPDDSGFRVSVGLFSDETRAEARAAAVRQLRLEPVVAPRTRQEATFWLELPGTTPDAVDLTHLAAEGVDTSALRIERCEDADDVSIDAIVPTGATTPEEAQSAAV